MALVNHRPIFKMAAIVTLYRQMLTGVRLHATADSMQLAETMIKFNLKSQVSILWGKIKSQSTENVCIA